MAATDIAGTAGGFTPVGMAFDAAKSIAGPIIGLVQMAAAKRAFAAARKLRPSNTDPQEAQYLQHINNQRNGIYGGARYGEALRQLRNAQMGSLQSINNNSGGNAAAAISAAGNTIGQVGDAYGKIYSDSMAYGAHLEDTAGLLTKSMIQRRSDLAANDYTQAIGRAGDLQSQGYANLGAGVARIGGNIDPDVSAAISRMFGNKPDSTTPTWTPMKPVQPNLYENPFSP